MKVRPPYPTCCRENVNNLAALDKAFCHECYQLLRKQFVEVIPLLNGTTREATNPWYREQQVCDDRLMYAGAGNH